MFIKHGANQDYLCVCVFIIIIIIIMIPSGRYINNETYSPIHALTLLAFCRTSFNTVVRLQLASSDFAATEATGSRQHYLCSK